MSRSSLTSFLATAIAASFLITSGRPQSNLPESVPVDVSPAYQQNIANVVVYNQKTYSLYPEQLDTMPPIPSPFASHDGMEVIVAVTRNDKFVLIPVTVENGDPYVVDMRLHFGKGNQLEVDARDFPALYRTGLHSEIELEQTFTITGKSIAEITYLARPWRSSGAGFMASDEDIISVLKNDNSMVKRMGLKHPELARPLFHTWNLILEQYRNGNIDGSLTAPFKYIIYNNNNVLLKAQGSRGFQYSIFNDEVLGNAQLDISRSLTLAEKKFLDRKYAHLDKKQMTKLVERLSHIHTGEMVPFYITRYGFYEGHTGYRADPITIAFIFGMKSLEDLDSAFQEGLYAALTRHFTRDANISGE